MKITNTMKQDGELIIRGLSIEAYQAYLDSKLIVYTYDYYEKKEEKDDTIYIFIGKRHGITDRTDMHWTIRKENMTSNELEDFFRELYFAYNTERRLPYEY